MPCDSIERSKVEFLANTTDKKLLAKGLRAHGYTVHESAVGLTISKGSRYGTYNATNGQLSIPTSWDSQEFKRAYSEQVVESQAREFGWELEWTTNKDGNREANVTKRSN